MVVCQTRELSHFMHVEYKYLGDTRYFYWGQLRYIIERSGGNSGHYIHIFNYFVANLSFVLPICSN